MFKNYKSIKTRVKGIGNCSLWVADTDTKRRKGFKGVLRPRRNQGMLFVYDEDVKHPFTMSGVKFPLKMIFLDRYFNVLEVLVGRPGIKSIKPSVNYRYVIELPL
jgi:uncharacterized membrane protein (UPF0127 family)